MSFMYAIAYHFFFPETPLVKNTFSNPFPKKRSGYESQKSGFGFDPKSLL